MAGKTFGDTSRVLRGTLACFESPLPFLTQCAFDLTLQKNVMLF
jgi:hypothetical protein